MNARWSNTCVTIVDARADVRLDAEDGCEERSPRLRARSIRAELSGSALRTIRQRHSIAPHLPCYAHSSQTSILP
jgi:hypothetical protein